MRTGRSRSGCHCHGETSISLDKYVLTVSVVHNVQSEMQILKKNAASSNLPGGREGEKRIYSGVSAVPQTVSHQAAELWRASLLSDTLPYMIHACRYLLTWDA